MSSVPPAIAPPGGPESAVLAGSRGEVRSPADPSWASGTVPRRRFFAGWTIGWAAVGCLVASGIAFTRRGEDLGPLLVLSVLFAEVVGFTALSSARLVFPLFARLPVSVQFALQAFTLFSGTVFGSIAVLATLPLFSLAQIRTVAMIVLVNGILSVIVGISLHTYDSMRRQIEASYRVLREKEALERELAIAREVQRELLPRTAPRVRGIELEGICLPAVGVGGDYFDFLPLAEDRVGLVIADVSGKGIPAALLMAGLQASVRSLALPRTAPCDVNRRLNEMLLRSTSSARYATFFFGVYDGSARTLTYSNAGHHPPFVLAGENATRLTVSGRPIGMLEDSTYGEVTCQLGVGDLIALFTDGVVETPNVDGTEFGDERLLELLVRHRRKDLGEILKIVIDEVGRWNGGGSPHDDITLVLARAA